MKQLKKADLKTLLGLGTDMLTLGHTRGRGSMQHPAAAEVVTTFCRRQTGVLQLWHQCIDIHNIWAFKKN